MGKIREVDFWQVMEETGGRFSMAVDLIKERFGVSITRQSVHARANKKPEKLREIEERKLDIAEDTIFDLMQNGQNENARLKAAETYIKYKGHVRGYTESKRIDMDVTTGGESLNLPVAIVIRNPHDESDNENTSNSE